MEASLSASRRFDRNCRTTDTDPSMRILIIEDNRTMARIIERGLENEGYSDFVLVESAEEAFDALMEQSFDLFLIDWMLPGVSGLDLARLLLDSETYGDCPIIITTAKDHSDHVKEALQAGVDAYIVKPINFSVFETKLREVLQAYPHIPRPPALSRSTVHHTLTSLPGFLWTAADGQLLRATPPTGRICGYAVEELLRQPALWFDRVHPDDAEAFERALNDLTPDDPLIGRYRWRDPDDEVRWIDTGVCRIEQGKKAYFSGLSVDVTGQVEDEATLRDRVKKLERENESLESSNEYLKNSVAELQRALDNGGESVVEN